MPHDATRTAADPAAAVLAAPTRAGIYKRLRTDGDGVSASDVADMFGLHPNVARGHLDQLADVGLVVVGTRRNPRGGRPAKIYIAREQATSPSEVRVPPGSQLGVHVVVQLIAGLVEHTAKLEVLAESEGRRLVDAAGGRAEARDLEAAVVVAVEGLRTAFPEVRMTGERANLAVEGLDIGLRLIGEVDGEVGDALARGFVRGAVKAAGAVATVTSQRGRLTISEDQSGAIGATPTGRVDARGRTYQAGIVLSMQAMEGMRAGEYLEVMTDLKGAPAAFARWADRAGHEVVDVTRVRDVRGSVALRLVLRKATGMLSPPGG
ncbi:MAG TPA: helix-turn-helix domain-containing protein [Nitriliruptoraceae bacterium]|nr:helix-turn-helix domain-containing protein [Nitriliruptoraceae bacterium]